MESARIRSSALFRKPPSDLKDVGISLREIYQFIERWTTEDIDLHGRRIRNAGISKDPEDYVIRKEIPALVSSRRTVQISGGGSSAAGYDKITFGLGVGAPLVAGDYVTPPYVWTNSRQGRASYAVILANTPPTGADIRFLLKKNDVSIMTNPYVTFPAGTAARQKVIFTTELVSGTFVRGDVVTPHVTQIGSIQAGQDITIVLFCDLL